MGRDPEMPKKPPSGWMLFLQEFRQKNPTVKLTEQTKLGGEAWKKMTTQQKAPYEQRAAPAMKTYKAAMAKYKESGKQAAWKAKVGMTKKQAKAKEAAKKQKEAEQQKKAKEVEKQKKA